MAWINYMDFKVLFLVETGKAFINAINGITIFAQVGEINLFELRASIHIL
jgi:hypothetical protein